MFKPHVLATVITCVALFTGSAGALADPGNGNGKDQSHAQERGKGNPQGGQGHGPGNQGNQGNQGSKGKSTGGHDKPHGPGIDRNNVLSVLGGHRDYWRPGPSLPPGVRQNLARGKPLPPGIAKKLDSRLLGRLPHYDGYEWQQAGTDLILVAVTTGIIYEVLNGAFN